MSLLKLFSHVDDFCVGDSGCQYGLRLSLISFCAHIVPNVLGALSKEIRQSALAVAQFFDGDVHAVEHGNPEIAEGRFAFIP
jgi:hypothetical protein